ncbi:MULTISPECIES: TniQ family protein [Burkholderia cepacia complex]|uniref:TniQ family protein n=3 Tax=Burkholderia cepacia complex TaxID=87882 RepID=A0ABD4U603_9BURK|nr:MULTISPECIES: TniQ family protein [Burkholderia cepacia complex]MCW3694286.1 TniQ family protein [Burkholderia cenocepacia]MCW3702487.1 TniQ family protein [Burkholderia cenocepacia]MCW3709757.1 TniQ family protein [Burkholderia cenocepacia]MCW3718241.1 TniQ family protein [Burkholderia cenocepacia]MCW3726625.1 TniQ family protein [Burkholderia cenocepacia]
MQMYDSRYRMPERALFATVPQAIDSAARQKLSDYVAHMAADAQVPVSVLVRTFVDWPANAKGKKLPFASGQRLGYVNGAGKTAHAWIRCLEPLVARQDLERLTLLPIHRTIGNITGWLTNSRRWCPICLQEDLEQGRRIYERLIWSVGLVRSCPEHRCSLVNVCPQCGFTHCHELDRRRLSGFCSRCGSWLGGNADIGGFLLGSQYDQWVAENFVALLAFPAERLNELSPQNWPGMLEAGIEVMANRKAVRFAELCATRASNICAWRAGKSYPSIRAVLRICWVFDIPLVDFLRGSQVAWTDATVRALPVGMATTVPRAFHRDEDWGYIKNVLTSYAAGERPCGSMRAVARELALDRSVLHRHFPELVRQIARLGQQERLDAAVAREIERRDRIFGCALRIVQILLAQDIYPSWRRIETILRDQYQVIITRRDNSLLRRAQIQGGVLRKRTERAAEARRVMNSSR